MHARTSTTSSRLIALASLLVCLAAPRIAAADPITLMWDANPEAGVAGYIVYAGTQPGSYTQQFDVGSATTFVFPGAVPGQRYCFAVSAYASGPLEGPKSAEVCGFSNQAPTLADPGSQVTTAGQATALQLAGSDPDGSPVSYGATGLPPGLSLMASTGFISGTPTTVGTHLVTATISDGVLTASRAFTWTILAADVTAPTVTITTPTSAATYTTSASSIAIAGTASDNAGVTQVTWVSSRGGSGVAGGTTSWSATIPLSSGTNVLTVRAFDAAGNSATDVLTVTVPLPGSGLTLAWDASTDPGVIGYKVHGGTTSGSYTQMIDVGPVTSWSMPSPVAGQLYCFAVSAYTATLESPLSQEVCGYSNQSPTLASVPNQASVAGQAVSLQLAGSDPDGAAVSYLVAGLPPGLAVLASTGLISGTPTTAGTYTVSATVSDGVLTASRTFAWTIAAANVAPVLAPVGAQSSTAGQPTTLQLAGSDANGDALLYAATGLPPGLSVAPGTGLVSGTPTTAGSYSVTASVTDGALSASRAFTWTVTGATPIEGALMLTWDASADPNVTGYRMHVGTTPGVYGQVYDVGLTTTWYLQNPVAGQMYCFAVSAYTATLESALSDEVCGYSDQAPTLAPIANQTTVVGQAVSLQLVGSDPEGAQVSFGANGLPPGLGVLVSSGLITGTPTVAGTFGVTATVYDGTLSTSRTFTWLVTPDTIPPGVTITGPTSSPSFTTTASSITLSGTASDNRGLSQVRWSSSRGSSGVAAGTTLWSASVPLLGGVNVLTVTAEDVDGNTATDVLTVTMNRPPTLAAVASQSSQVGSAASLQLSGSDPDGDPLTFGALGLPPGLSVAAATGLVTGTPTTAGTYAVTATVSDGTLSASRSFTWTVTAASSNQAPTLDPVEDQVAWVDADVWLQFSGYDANGDALTYTAVNLPEGLSMHASTGVVSGTPTKRAAGSYTVTVTVSDGTQSASRSFTWVVLRGWSWGKVR